MRFQLALLTVGLA